MSTGGFRYLDLGKASFEFSVSGAISKGLSCQQRLFALCGSMEFGTGSRRLEQPNEDIKGCYPVRHLGNADTV